ncbi:MAG: IMP cyclohydrolase [Clostridia bacterium]|nr:IMP cyclohydrolase [Clostridia bacterium]
MENLVTLLSTNAYPGRGIVLGVNPEGTAVRIGYFIMGRSENSRNRVFTSPDADTLLTEPADPAKVQDPSLIIYAPVRRLGDTLIVTNGDQTDTVFEALKAGKRFRDALVTRTFEPDPPNYTPRISGLVNVTDGKASFEMAILKSLDGDSNYPVRHFFTYEGLPAGTGLFLHTYEQDGNPLPTFAGEPTRVAITGDLESWTKEVWESLHAENKISLYTAEYSLADGTLKGCITNKYHQK